MLPEASRFDDVRLLRKSAACRIFSKVVFLVLALLIIPCFMNTGEAQAASISGTVTNDTEYPGWVYLNLNYDGGGNSGFGTAVYVSASGSAAYTIRGVSEAGAYVVNAFLDRYGRSIQLANSPVGAYGAFGFSGSNILGADLTVSNPAPVALTDNVPLPDIATTSTAALISFDSKKIKKSGLFVPETMRVYWGYTGDCYANTENIPLNGRGRFLILKGLTSGGTLCGKLVPVVNGSVDTSHQSADFSVVLTTPSVGSSLTGTINSTGITKGSAPLFIAAQGSNGAYITYVDNPADNQSYSISGVSAGAYQVNAFLDMDNNKYMAVPDIATGGDNQIPTIVVDGTNPLTVPDIFLSDGPVTARTGTAHYLSDGGEFYSLNFPIRPKTKQPVAATLIAGPQLTVPIDLAYMVNYGDIEGWPQVSARPSVGDTYTVQVIYSDNSSENLSLPVTAVLDYFAGLKYPVGDTAPDSLIPLFSWANSSAGMIGYFDFRISVWDAAGASVWEKNDLMPANQLSVLYNDDSKASSDSLTPGAPYDWGIQLRDAFGNKAEYRSSFTPRGSGPSVTGFTPTYGRSGDSVIITGTGFDVSTPENNIVRVGGAEATEFTVDSATQITATVPTSPKGPVTVSVGDVTATTSASYVPNVNFPGKVKSSSNSNINGVTVETVGLTPFNSEFGTTSAGSGDFTVTVPAGVPFSIRFSKSGYLDSYSARFMRKTDNISSNYTLYTAADLAGISGITPSSGKGLIRAKVTEYDNSSNVLTGAVVTAVSKNHGANYYTVAYTDPSDAAKIVYGNGTATHTDGVFYVLNVDEGDYVLVTAAYAGWGFEPRTYITHANSVSQARLKGAPAPVVTATPVSGTYASGLTVTLTAGDDAACSEAYGGCRIFYTNEGSDPRFFGSEYTTAIPISGATTLRFYAFNNDVDGNVGSADYVIGTPVNGVCGPASWQTFTTAPTTNLCSAGTASGVSGTGPWTWSCAGLYGGTNSNCSANVKLQYPLTVNTAGTGSGTVTGAGIYDSGATATVTATAATGSKFSGWSGACAGTTSPTTVLMDGAKTCTATFTKYYTITAKAKGTGAGSVVSAPAGINYKYPKKKTDSELYAPGKTVKISAKASAGSKASWNNTCKKAGGKETGNKTKTAVCTIKVSKTAVVTATFTK
jgi:hypothetical protein